MVTAGEPVLKIEMQFLSDVFIKCPECNGRRYREHVLGRGWPAGMEYRRSAWTTADEVIEFLNDFPESRSAAKALAKLQLPSDVGLGYLRLGQPVNTLSGGESQRLKLVRSLAEAQGKRTDTGPTLFLFDEPTTGLHFDDVRLLSKVLHRLVDEGHTVVVVGHNLDLIRQADWMTSGRTRAMRWSTGRGTRVIARNRRSRRKALRA